MNQMAESARLTIAYVYEGSILHMVSFSCDIDGSVVEGQIDLPACHTLDICCRFLTVQL